MAKKSVVKVAKYEGDDIYSWAVFVRGWPKWTGMSRDEAQWRAETERKALGEK